MNNYRTISNLIFGCYFRWPMARSGSTSTTCMVHVVVWWSLKQQSHFS